MNYTDITKFFGRGIYDPQLQTFLKSAGCYPENIQTEDLAYLSSKDKSIEFGFYLNEGAEGAIFSLCNLYPHCSSFLHQLPFNLSFSDTKELARAKAGKPLKEVNHQSNLIKKHFIIDHFKAGEQLAVSVDYNAESKTIEMIQIRDNELVEDYLKL